MKRQLKKYNGDNDKSDAAIRSIALTRMVEQFDDKDKKEYYCIRCQYTGTEEDVLEKNEMVRFRYRAMMKRFDKFDFD